MKLLSIKLEKKAIRSICGSPKKISGLIFGSLDESYFYYEPCKEVFHRISVLAKKTGAIPDFTELSTDPAISEETRKILLKYKQPPIKTRSRATRLIGSLDDYRKLRGLYFNAEQTIKAVKGDKVDIEELIETNSDNLTELRSSLQKTNVIMHIGRGHNATPLVKEALTGDRPPVIPTGFRAFDSVNGGIFPGALFTVAAMTGGGKSAVSQQMMLNMTLRGYDTALVPLEMTEQENMYRILANLSGIDMNKIILKKLTRGEKKLVWESFKRYVRDVHRLGARYSIYAPEEDQTVEEILFMLRPYAYKAIVIDYISLLKGVDGNDSVTALSRVARAAKVFAKNNNVAVVMLAQLNDQGDVKYARAIKEHSDICWVWNYTDENRQSGILDIRMLKARNQQVFPFQLAHDYSIMRVRDTDDAELKRMRTAKGDVARKSLDQFAEDINLDDEED